MPHPLGSSPNLLEEFPDIRPGNSLLDGVRGHHLPGMAETGRGFLSSFAQAPRTTSSKISK